MTVLCLIAAKWHVTQHTDTISVVLLYMRMWAGGCLHSFLSAVTKDDKWMVACRIHVGKTDILRCRFADLLTVKHITGAVIPKGTANLKQYFKKHKIKEISIWIKNLFEILNILIYKMSSSQMIEFEWCVQYCWIERCVKRNPGLNRWWTETFLTCWCSRTECDTHTWHYLQGSTGFWVT